MKPVSASDICRPASAYCPKERIKSERVRFFTAAEGGPLVLPVTFQHRSYQHSVLPWLRPAHCVLWTHILGMFFRQGSFVRYTRRGPHFISSCLLLVASFLPLFCRLFFFTDYKAFWIRNLSQRIPGRSQINFLDSLGSETCACHGTGRCPVPRFCTGSDFCLW